MQIAKDEVGRLLARFDQTEDGDVIDEALDVVESATPLATANPAMIADDQTRILLGIINHIDAKAIPNFDFGRLPQLNVTPPLDSQLPSGVDPMAIADPGLRAEYEKEIAENRKWAAIYHRQSRLRQIAERVMTALEEHVARQYLESGEALLLDLIYEAVRSATRAAQIRSRVSVALARQRTVEIVPGTAIGPVRLGTLERDLPAGSVLTNGSGSVDDVHFSLIGGNVDDVWIDDLADFPYALLFRGRLLVRPARLATLKALFGGCAGAPAALGRSFYNCRGLTIVCDKGGYPIQLRLKPR